MARDIKRLNEDLRLLCNKYGSDRVFWPRDGSWIMVKDFPLPSNFKQKTTNILILVPDNYGYGGCYRDIFISPDLELLDKKGRSYRRFGSDIHGYEEIPYSNLPKELKTQIKNKKWYYLCLHDKNPMSSIINYLFKVSLFLSNPYKDWKAISNYRR